MNVLVVYAHPNPHSLNAALLSNAVKVMKELGHNVKVSDLYVMGFNPVASWQDFSDTCADEQQYFLAQQRAYENAGLAADIVTELEKLQWADHVVFQFPLWWFGMPAIMKGWLDRVLVKGYAYDKGKVFATGLLQGKSASMVVTTQSPEAAFAQDSMHQADIGGMLHPITNTLRFVGMDVKSPLVFFAAAETAALAEPGYRRNCMRSYFSESYVL